MTVLLDAVIGTILVAVFVAAVGYVVYRFLECSAQYFNKGG